MYKMFKRAKVRLVLALLCCTAQPALAQAGKSTPELVAVLASKVTDQKDREAAIRELGVRGERVMPDVLKTVEAGTDIEQFYDLFEELGPKAKSALPLLTARLSNKKQVLGAGLTMMRIQSDALVSLPEVTKQKAAAACYDAIVDPKADEMDRWCGIVLAGMGKSSAPTFLRLLQDKNPKNRRLAAEVLLEARFSDERIEAELIRLTRRGEDLNVRTLAVRVLGEFGEPSPKAKAALLAMLKDAPPYDFPERDERKIMEMRAWREMANRAADSLGRYGPALIDDLVPLLSPMEAPSRIPAITALRSIGTPAVPRLIGLLGHKDQAIAISASIALNELGHPAVPELAKALSTGNEQVINHATNALWWIGPGAKAALPSIFEVVGSENHSDVSRVAAARAAVRIDARASRKSKAIVSAVPVLIRVLDKGTFEHQGWAAQALGGIGAPAGAALPMLRKRLELPDAKTDTGGLVQDYVQRAAKEAISSIESDIGAKK